MCIMSLYFDMPFLDVIDQYGPFNSKWSMQLNSAAVVMSNICHKYPICVKLVFWNSRKPVRF